MKILYVEDDEIISQLAREIFMTTSHNVIICPSPEDVIKALGADVFDLIVLDMNFPVGTGDDVLRYIHENNIHVPVIIHSGFVDRFCSCIEYYKNKGIVKSVHNKPLSVSMMLGTINAIK